jgi:hypothetical protein
MGRIPRWLRLAVAHGMNKGNGSFFARGVVHFLRPPRATSSPPSFATWGCRTCWCDGGVRPRHALHQRLLALRAALHSALHSAQSRRDCTLRCAGARRSDGDAHRREVRFAVGNEVLLDTEHTPLPSRSLLSPRWMGPFKVLACPAPSTYRLDLPSSWWVLQRV